MNVIEIESDSKSSSSSDEYNYINKQKEIKTFINKKHKNEISISQNKYNKISNFISDSDSESEYIPVNKYSIKSNNNFIQNNSIQNKPNENSIQNKPIENKNNNYTKNKYVKPIQDKINKSESFLQEFDKINISLLDSEFDLIPADKLDDLPFLNNYYPTIFLKGTQIIFRVLELSIETGGPQASQYKQGIIEEFVYEHKSFLIKLIGDKEDNLISLYGVNSEEDLETNLINVNLKDFIELRVKKSELNKIYFAEEKIITNEIVGNIKESITNINQNIIIENKEEQLNPLPIVINKEEEKPKEKAYNKIVLPYIKKQVEFYFSDKNYYKDPFLLEKAKLNEENCKININFINFLDINLDIIMGFNKLKALTNKRDELVTALRDSTLVEFNIDNTKIRKKNLIKEFL